MFRVRRPREDSGVVEEVAGLRRVVCREFGPPGWLVLEEALSDPGGRRVTGKLALLP
jgi:hypothetical protein